MEAMGMKVARSVRMLIILLLTVVTCAVSAEAGYVDHHDGTVSDARTGLMWQQADDQNDVGRRNWEEALAYCEALDLAKHHDWRLPNYRELASLVDYSRYEPSINPIFSCRSDWYWSSSTYVYYPDCACFVNFVDGHVVAYTKTDNSNYIRCVRGGPSDIPFPFIRNPHTCFVNFVDGHIAAYTKTNRSNHIKCVRGGPSDIPTPFITSFAIHNGDPSTKSTSVILNNTVLASTPTHYMASESSDFSGATWQTYSTAPSFTLSSGNGTKTVYFKVKNVSGTESMVAVTVFHSGEKRLKRL
jgi:hypothetical protein